METRHKILLVDDDPDLLELYRESLSKLPSQAEIHVATSGSRALAMLDAAAYRVIISDLRMPRMDGLQLLSIVRRKYPELRTVALTSVADEQFRSRVYALGVDLYWHKPGSEEEMAQFLECLEALVGREIEDGFRGVQSKSLVDLVQLECISQSSAVLRITNGPLVGRIWIEGGDVRDAECEEARGEDAFRMILSWKAGSFEFLPAEADRPRTIFKSYNALLLECAQAIDEASNAEPPPAASPGQPASTAPTANAATEKNGLGAIIQTDGVEFALKMLAETRVDCRGLENPGRIADWSRKCVDRFSVLGDALQAGMLEQVTGVGPQRNVAVAPKGSTRICVGWKNDLDADDIRHRMKKILALWVS
jgi:CheY-like chemotaxis protein